MKKLLFVLFFAFKSMGAECMAQLLKIDFSNSKSIEDYISSDPNVNQLSAIDKSNKESGLIAIESDMLKFTRATTATVSLSFSRVKAFAGPPKVIICEFDIQVEDNLSKETTAAMFQVGSEFTKANSSNGRVHSRFSVNFTDTPGEFSIKDSKQGGASGAVLSGRKRLKFIVNNLGSAYSYDIKGESYQVEPKKWDLFVDDEAYLLGKESTDPAAELEHIKFFFDKGIGSISVGNILIHTPTILPVRLENFNVSHRNNWADISWKTTYERKVKAFEVHKSLNGTDFKRLISVKSEGKSAHYFYRDEYPVSGISYYKLLQVGENGNIEELSVKSLNINRSRDFAVYTASDGLIVNYEASREGIATLVVSNINGQKVLERQLGFSEGVNKLYLDAILKEGIYLVNADFDGDKYVKKLILK